MEEEGCHIYGEGLYILIVRENCLRVCFRSVHNVCIECLWVDVTGQIGSSWADAFTNLELFHGLDINNPHHIWLLHILFLSIINSELELLHQDEIATEYRSGMDQTAPLKICLVLILI